MHDLLDDYAHSNALKDLNPRLKLALGLGAILFCVSSASPIAPLIVAATMGLITMMLAKIPGRFYIKLQLMPLSFALLSSIAVALMHGTGDYVIAGEIMGHTLGIRTDGANLALLLISRTIGGMCALFFIALTTPMIEIFAVLRSLRIPSFVIELSMMIYRYIFVFLDQAAMIHNAQVMRLGDAGIKNCLHSFAMLSSILFLRSWEQGERLIVAMDARCYDGKLDLMDQTGNMRPKASCAVVAYLAAILAITILTRDIQLL